MIYGWLVANKVSVMKFRHLTGFMLGNNRCAHMVGECWSDSDCRVWLCPSLAKEEKVLQKSQMERLEPETMWTTIYQVSAKDIVCEQSGNGLLYTNTPSKIFVERIVAHHMPCEMTQDQLLARARNARHRFATLIEGLNREDVR